MSQYPTHRSIIIHRPADCLRVGRLSIPGRCYFITKRVHSIRNPIFRHPRQPELDHDTATVLIDALRWMHDHRRIRLHAYVLMPDHIHLLFALKHGPTLDQVMSSCMTWTARNINRLRNTSGRFWMREYHDARIKSRRSFWAHLNYIRMNPVKAGLVERPEDWPYVDTKPDW